MTCHPNPNHNVKEQGRTSQELREDCNTNNTPSPSRARIPNSCMNCSPMDCRVINSTTTQQQERNNNNTNKKKKDASRILQELPIFQARRKKGVRIQDPAKCHTSRMCLAGLARMSGMHMSYDRLSAFICSTAA